MSRNLQMVVNIDTTINGITTTLKLSLTTPLDGTSYVLRSYMQTVSVAILCIFLSL